MNGTENSGYFNSMVFTISKCINETKNGTCAPQSEIDAFVARITTDTWTHHDVVDLSIHDKEPTVHMETWVKSNLLTEQFVQTNWINLAKNDVETEDALFHFGQLSFELTYFSVDEMKETKSYAPKMNKGLLFQNIYVFDQHSWQYKRVSYNVLDLIGDIGGVFELFVTICGILFNSIAEHSFVLSAMKKIFLVKTSEPEVF